MKTKLMLVLAAFASGSAFAADVTMNGASRVEICAGTANTYQITKNATPAFIQEDFKQGCSANVYMSIAEDNTSAWGASGSKKGKNYFIGNTNGGAPKSSGTTVTSSCTDCKAPDGDMTAAKNMGSS